MKRRGEVQQVAGALGDTCAVFRTVLSKNISTGGLFVAQDPITRAHARVESEQSYRSGR